MKLKLLFLSITLCLLFPHLGNAQGKLNDSIVKALKIGIEGFKNRYHSPSIVVVIVHDNDIVFSEALGYVDIKNNVPASINSKYPILSITKMFTATMCMQLVQNNHISLDDDIKKYLPEYLGDDSGTTFMQLATHTSGLPRNSPADIHFAKQINKWLLANENYTTIESATKKDFLESLRFIRKEYPEFQLLGCGDRHYSNLGYSMLGIGLERAADNDYSDYVITNICLPLKMTHTGFMAESTKNNTLAKGYYYKTELQEFVETPIYKANSIIYAGGMYSTASDLAKFIRFQFDDTSVAMAEILSPKNKRMMQHLGIGWKRSHPFVFHEGSMLGYRSVIAINLDIKIGWVILTNTTDFEFGKINDYISQLILPIYGKKPVTDLSKYVGTYRLDGGYDSLKIYLKGEKLYSTYLSESFPEEPLVSAGNNGFKGPGNASYGIRYDFITNAKSEITALNLDQLMWVKQ